MAESIRELTQRIASGNPEAFARFYRAWFDRAVAFARRGTGRDESFCLDVVQDAMMRVIRTIRPMETDSQVSAWLRAVTMRCAYDRLRREARIQRREQGRTAPNRAINDASATRIAWLRAELADLDPRVVSLLALRYRLGWTLKRIGQTLGLKPGAVDGRIRRATLELKEKAMERFDD